MELLDKLAFSNIDPATLAQVRVLFAEKDFKLTALTVSVSPSPSLPDWLYTPK